MNRKRTDYNTQLTLTDMTETRAPLHCSLMIESYYLFGFPGSWGSQDLNEGILLLLRQINYNLMQTN